MKNATHVIKYKDGKRIWWTLEIKKGRAHTELNEDNEPIINGDPDYYWEYELISKNDEMYGGKFSGAVRGQYDRLPTTNEFLSDIQVNMNSLFMGMARHTEIFPVETK